MDKERYFKIIAERLGHHLWQVENTIRLIDDGATIPFISRYRKEMTGSLDEVQIAHIRDEYSKLTETDKRRGAIIKSMKEQGVMTPELDSRLAEAVTLTELEDIYLPYRPKRRTRASMAKEKGLQPLAIRILKQEAGDVAIMAEEFVNNEVKSVEEALQGARDIIAESFNENEISRKRIRRLFEKDGQVVSRLVKGKAEEGSKFSDYFEWQEPLHKIPGHRYLAMRRGEDEGVLKLHLSVEDDKALEILERYFIKSNSPSSEHVREAIADSWKRLLAPAMETEFRKMVKERADLEAIDVFSENLRQLLLAPPLGEKSVLAIDPGYRTGCKIVCLNRQGVLMHNETIYPHPPQNETARSVKKISTLVDSYRIEAIAIGNGTASRETEDLIRFIRFDRDIEVYVVSEAGASVYSASKTAREEFPDYDVTVRGSVSIGRRLMDPLAELVKIDPGSIGVGQYQHDVDQTQLKSALDDAVVSCVNAVGVEVNTSSRHLLTYVSGLGPQLAGNIVEYRTENGPFSSREELKKVKRMGEKAFEQSAGFIRVRNSENPLDHSAVHPERYYIVERMARDINATVAEIMQDDELRKKIDLEKYIDDNTGLPTLNDIMQELGKSGRDPRSRIKEFRFADIRSIEDVREGMVVPGIVTNITRFGAFVDIGVKNDGLVHISQLSDRFVKDPSEIVKLHQHVMVKVTGVDYNRKRIELSMKQTEHKK